MSRSVLIRHAAPGRLLTLSALCTLVSLIIAASACAQPDGIRVVRETEWIALLDRDYGWNAADGCISLPVNGIEAPGIDPHPRTLFTFGDSIIGRVGQDGRRLPGNKFINNSMLYLDGAEPDPSHSAFIYVRDDGGGNPRAAFVPSTPDSMPGDYFWLLDGLAIGEDIHIFANHLRPDPNGFWPINLGVTMITIAKDSRPPFESQQQVKTPLYHPAEGEIGPYQFGPCFVSNTQAAGWPNPDGYVYAFGVREDPWVKKSIVARVRPEQFTDFSAWRFWNGGEWVEGLTNAAPMTGRISGVYSVSPMPDGRWIMVFQKDAIGPEVAIRIGAGPTGPWGELRAIYHCPETDRDPDIFAYNATAHPHLSRPGELLISYSVNSWDFEDAFTWADLARPRFISLRVD
ncbi:MAG: DUF4185 domain-containing protein [Phycisphaerales bacterium]|nr:DUF4185 domain-containing protein [Phycisphaerales bacterium]